MTPLHWAPPPAPSRQVGDDPDPGNALQVYLRDIRRTPLLTPGRFNTALAARRRLLRAAVDDRAQPALVVSIAKEPPQARLLLERPHRGRQPPA